VRKNSGQIKEEYNNFEEEEQSGFRARRSYADNICYLKHIIEKKMAKNQKIQIRFIYQFIKDI